MPDISLERLAELQRAEKELAALRLRLDTFFGLSIQQDNPPKGGKSPLAEQMEADAIVCLNERLEDPQNDEDVAYDRACEDCAEAIRRAARQITSAARGTE